MSIELLTLILFASMLLLLATGLHISFAIGGIAAIFAILLWGPDHLTVLGAAAISSIANINLASIPLFVFLGWVFESSGIGDDLFETVYLWLGNVPGGLAVGCMIISVLLAAICGDLAATIFMLGAIALPPMLKRGYNKHLVLGTIAMGGLLGLIIPPSILIIIYSTVVGESVGKMYLGCFIPGLMIAFLGILYILITCRLNPTLGPPAPPETRVGWGARIASLRSVVLPLGLIIFIMAGIYGGIMSPLEASSAGAVGALIIAAIYRRLNWQVLKRSIYNTLNLSGLLVWLFMAVGCFTSVYQGIGAPELAAKLAYAIPGAGWGTFAVMQTSLVGLGMIMDDLAITLIFAPIYSFVIKGLGFDTLWYGVTFVINMIVAFLSPPYGFALFYMKSAIPKEYDLTMIDVWRGVIPYIIIVLIVLILVILFPPIATWLPTLIIGR